MSKILANQKRLRTTAVAKKEFGIDKLTKLQQFRIKILKNKF